MAAADEQPSEGELRFYVLGKTDSGRRLFVVFKTGARLIPQQGREMRGA